MAKKVVDKNQKNQFVFLGVKDETKLLGDVLSQLYHKSRRRNMPYLSDLYTWRDMYTVVDGFKNSLGDGEMVRAYFMNDENSGCVEITSTEVKSVYPDQ